MNRISVDIAGAGPHIIIPARLGQRNAVLLSLLGIVILAAGVTLVNSATVYALVTEG